jgi:hypothetical protein
VTQLRREVVLKEIVRVLGPYIGASMAGSAARMHCEKLGVGATLCWAEIARLLDALGPGLRVFLGKRSTEEAIGAIRGALLDGGGAR